MSVKISVIIPAYNVEQYVAECLESVLSQSLTSIEVICINDGSSDATLDILNEYKERDNRVVVLTQENKGVSASRNRGIASAQGEYLYFIDADDMLKENALEILYRNVKEKELDVLYFDSDVFFMSDRLREDMKLYLDYYVRKGDYCAVTTGKRLFVSMQVNGEYRVSPCLKIMNREYCLRTGLHFHEGVLFEDNAFELACILNATRVCHLKEQLYLRRMREDSTVTQKTKFAHAYGYYIAYVDMTRIASGLELDSEELLGVSNALNGVLSSARRKYHELSESEKQRRSLLEEADRVCFEMLVEKYDRVWQDRDKLQESVDKFKADAVKLKAKIVAMDEKISKLQNDKKRLASEKQSLKKENKKLKNSVSYRIGRVLTKPFRWIKRKLHK